MDVRRVLLWLALGLFAVERRGEHGAIRYPRGWARGVVCCQPGLARPRGPWERACGGYGGGPGGGRAPVQQLGRRGGRRLVVSPDGHGRESRRKQTPEAEGRGLPSPRRRGLR